MIVACGSRRRTAPPVLYLRDVGRDPPRLVACDGLCPPVRESPSPFLLIGRWRMVREHHRECHNDGDNCDPQQRCARA